MSNHKVGDLLYGPTGLGIIKKVDSENNGGYPYVVEWYGDKGTPLPSYHNSDEVEYFKRCLGRETGYNK